MSVPARLPPAEITQLTLGYMRLSDAAPLILAKEAGLFEQIGERYGVDLVDVPAVGDTLRDVQAGSAVGCQPHLVLTGKGAAFRNRALPEGFPANTQVHEDLAAFVGALLAREAARAHEGSPRV